MTFHVTSSGKERWVFALIIAFIMVVSFPYITSASKELQSRTAVSSVNFPIGDLSSLMHVSGYNSQVPSDLLSNTNLISDHFTATADILIDLYPSNLSGLNSFLSQLSNPYSPSYHKYLTKQQFDSLYGGSPLIYDNIIQYLRSYGVTSITTYSDHMEIAFSANMIELSSIFHVSMGEYHSSRGDFYAPMSQPVFPAYLAKDISGIQGLTNYYTCSMSMAPLNLQKVHDTTTHSLATGLPQPANVKGVQFLFGSEMQVAMNESSLFCQFGYPTNMVVATILWSGQYTGSTTVLPSGGVLESGTYVGPYVPSDIYSYFNQTLPPGVPHSNIYAYPINGGPPPGPLAAYDSTQANVENTLDLEMIGSVAPGASIYNVYANNSSSIVLLDQAFSSILNPSAKYSALDNVSVISNSWGGSDGNDTGWYLDLMEAQARGITVLAASGDSGDSSSYIVNGSSDYVSFPASMAYDTFGTTAVGGVTINLNSALKLENVSNWYVPGSLTTTSYGTTSGISACFPEPSYQRQSSANTLIRGTGRGVPDISALANNTVMTLSLSGTTYEADSAYTGGNFAAVSGTSIASPITAGIVAEIDHAMKQKGLGPLGYLNPDLYAIANEEYRSIFTGSVQGYYGSGYNSSLPSEPVYPVLNGYNALYTARYGYSLLNGWGIVNAYNLTSYLMNYNYTGTYGVLSGISDQVSLPGLNATSYYANGSVLTSVNASVQQDFYLSSSLGTPLYWAQNILQFYGENSTGYFANFSLTVERPYQGLFPGLSVSTFNFTHFFLSKTGNFSMNSTLSTGPTMLDSMLIATVAGHSLQLSVPGGAYIIGKVNYPYYVGSAVFVNNPLQNGGSAGNLAPQFVLAGGLFSKAGVFGPGTIGSVTPLIQPYGTSAWIQPEVSSVNYSNNQGDSVGANLAYQQSGKNTWSFSYSAYSTEQGIAFYVPGNYNVTFTETGLPAGTNWFVNIVGLPQSGPIAWNSSFTTSVTDGPYRYSVHASNSTYSPQDNGTFVINGDNLTINITFKRQVYPVDFKVTGLPAGVTWSVNVSGYGTSPQVSGSLYTLNLTNGTYSYSISRTSTDYTSAYMDGTFTVSGSQVQILIPFFELLYSVSISETGLQADQNWTIMFNGTIYTMSSIPLLLSLSNGSYEFTVTTISGYSISPQNGTFIVSGGAAQLVIEFTKHTPISPEIEYYLIIAAMLIVASVIFYFLVRRKQ